ERGGDAQPGRLALLRPARGGVGRARVERVLGRPDVARDALEGFMLHRGLQRRFPPGVDRAAREAVERPFDAPARRDLTALPTFTIDPVTAKDFDDAISAERLGDGHWRIWVHIADVSAFVRPGSAIDREAHRRATSVYVPGAVEPMLPEALSNDACSLRPGADRLAVTVEMELRGADVVRAAFHRSTVRSDERLDYDRVDRVFAGDEPARDPWAGPLAVARQAAAALQARRDAQGALAVESVEPEFAFDRRGHVTGTESSEQTESHRLIEHLMIAANEQVARLLSDRGVPALYRVHERPDPPAVERLVDALASLGVATPPVPEHLAPAQAAGIVAECSRLIDQHVRRTGHGRMALTSLLLRSLKQARYDPQNLGHAGLGLEHYCHFTSPIRRYPDLVCHRALLSAVGGREDAPRAGALDEAGAWTSARERDAMSIERGADAIARCFLLERELFESGWDAAFDGEVTGVIGAGAFVAFGDGQEGMIPVRRLRGDWWELNEQGTILLGTETGRAIRLGDPVRVRVRQVDTLRGRVDLDLVAPA
ncbi:MAG TPA: RNB domain-containing ribonuclease, partial [Solirubrobacteraceae bacterium]|nr:RNB domain-containing ribonuclease [Solirubrobacteraceae bacterium]